MRVLSRMWQMLLKGIAEVQNATRPQAAAEMVLVRIAYVADLPTPDEAIKMIGEGGGTQSAPSSASGSNAAPRAPAPASFAQSSALRTMPPQRSSGETVARQQPQPVESVAPQSVPTRRLSSYPEIVALASEKRDIALKAALEADLRLVRMEDGRLEIALERSAARSVVNDLQRKLEQWTGRRWAVVVSNEEGQPTLRAQAQERKDKLTENVQADPRVQAVMAAFPGAQVVDVRRLAPEPPPAVMPIEDDADGDDDDL
jgi:DNA polymerase-3 subunit gamma/tau